MTLKTPLIFVWSTAASAIAMVAALHLLPLEPIGSPKGFGIAFAAAIWMGMLQLFNATDAIKRDTLTRFDRMKFIGIGIVVGASIGIVERMFNMY